MARILIVDDSPTQMGIQSRILENQGHEIITATNGREGVEVAMKEMPDLILMDVVMPEMSGFQATRKITHEKSTSHIPVILVSTKNQETDIVWGKRQGASGYVVKPVDENLLIETINDLLPETTD